MTAPEFGVSSRRAFGRPATSFGLALLLCIAAVVRFYGSDRCSIWVDESQRVTWAKGEEFDRLAGLAASQTGIRLPPRGFRDALRVINRHNPPLNALALNLAITLGLETDAELRGVAAVFGILTVLVCWLLGRMLSNTAGAFFSGILVAISPAHVYFAQEVNHYALAGLLVAVALLFWLKMLESATLWNCAGYVAAATASIYTHYYCLISIIFMAAAGAWLKGPGPRARMSILCLSLTPLILFLPYLPILHRQLPELTATSVVGVYNGIPGLLNRLLANFGWTFLGPSAEGASASEISLIAAAALVLLAGAVRRLGRRGVALCALAIGPVVLVSIAYIVFKKNSILWFRYQFFFTIPLVVALGVGTAEALRRMRWRLVGAAVLLCSSLFGSVSYARGFCRGSWNVLGARAAVSDAREPVLVAPSNLSFAAARYLDPNREVDGIDFEVSRSQILQRVRTAPGAWLALSWNPPDSTEVVVRSALKCRFQHEEILQLAPGLDSLRAFHYRMPREQARSCFAPEPWMLPVPGQLHEGANLEVEGTMPAGLTNLRGWAYSTAGLSELWILVDGRLGAAIPHPGIRRPDVAAASSPDIDERALNSGFAVNVDLSPGAHELTLEGVHGDGSEVVLGRYRTRCW